MMPKLPFDLKGSNKPSTFLTVDIGSDSVKCFAFEVDDADGNAVASIVGIGKSPLRSDSSRAGTIVDEDDVYESLKEAITQATENGNTYKDVVFGVNGHLSFGFMVTVRITRGKQDEITKKEIDTIHEKIYEAAQNQVQNVLMESTGNVDMDVQLITSSTVYTKLDDVTVKDPVGEIGQKLEVAVFFAFSPTYHLNTLKKLARKLKLKTLAVGSQMYAVVRSLTYSKGSAIDCVVVDVGGEATDVGVVFGGGIVSTKSLDIGSSHFTRYLVRDMGVSFDEAERKKKDYSYGNLSESDALKIKGYLGEPLKLWLDGLELLFQEFVGVKTFAPKIFLTGGGVELPDVAEIVSNEPWTKAIPFKSLPEFSKLSIEDFPKVVDRTGKAGSMEDVVPAALSVVYLEVMGYIND